MNPTTGAKWYATLSLVSSFGFVLIAFWPAVSFDYAHTDDWLFWGYYRDSVQDHPQYRFYHMIGRPVTGIITGVVGRCINTLADLRVVRALSILVVSLATVLVTQRLVTLGVSRINALLFALAVFLLPAVQVYVSWVTCFPFTFSILFAVVGGWLADSCPIEISDLWRPDSRLHIVSVFGFLGLALAIYPPTAAFFLLFPVMSGLFSREPSSAALVKRIVRDMIFFATACAGYFVFFRYVADAGASLGDYSFRVTSDPFARLSWFVSEITWRALNLWTIRPSWLIAGSVLALMMTGIAIAFIRNVAAGGVRQAAGQSLLSLSIAVALIGLMNAPLLLSRNIHNGYRVYYPYSAAIVLLVFWSSEKITRIVFQQWHDNVQAAALLLAVGLVGVLAHDQVARGFAQNDAIEFSYFHERLATVPAGQEFHVILPQADYRSVFGDKPHLDEFGLFASGAADQGRLHIKMMTLYALHEPEPEQVHLRIWDHHASVPAAPYVIDMSELQSYPRPWTSAWWPLPFLVLVLGGFWLLCRRLPQEVSE